MRRSLIGLAVVLGLGMFATPSQAQTSGFSDPFFLYYGFYLPRQQALAAQPQPIDMIRERSEQRQYTAQTDRAGLYDPVGRLGMEELDPLRPFGTRSGSTRLTRTTPMGLPASNINGAGPSSHFNRIDSYYPTLRTGRFQGRGGSRAAGFGGNYNASSMMPRPTSGMMPGYR